MGKKRSNHGSKRKTSRFVTTQRYNQHLSNKENSNMNHRFNQYEKRVAELQAMQEEELNKMKLEVFDFLGIDESEEEYRRSRVYIIQYMRSNFDKKINAYKKDIEDNGYNAISTPEEYNEIMRVINEITEITNQLDNTLDYKCIISSNSNMERFNITLMEVNDKINVYNTDNENANLLNISDDLFNIINDLDIEDKYVFLFINFYINYLNKIDFKSKFAFVKYSLENLYGLKNLEDNILRKYITKAINDVIESSLNLIKENHDDKTKESIDKLIETAFNEFKERLNTSNNTLSEEENKEDYSNNIHPKNDE